MKYIFECVLMYRFVCVSCWLPFLNPLDGRTVNFCIRAFFRHVRVSLSAQQAVSQAGTTARPRRWSVPTSSTDEEQLSVAMVGEWLKSPFFLSLLQLPRSSGVVTSPEFGY